MKFIKKYAVIALLALAAFNVKAQLSVTATIPSGGFSNLVSGPIVAGSFVLSTTNATATSLSFFDTPYASGPLRYTNAAYIQLSSYATNWIQCWTNFYGRTNCWTNTTVIDVTNTVSATFSNFNNVLTAVAPANGNLVIPNVSFLFNLGVGVTNLSASNATVTVNYTKQSQ